MGGHSNTAKSTGGRGTLDARSRSVTDPQDLCCGNGASLRYAEGHVAARFDTRLRLFVLLLAFFFFSLNSGCWLRIFAPRFRSLLHIWNL